MIKVKLEPQQLEQGGSQEPPPLVHLHKVKEEPVDAVVDVFFLDTKGDSTLTKIEPVVPVKDEYPEENFIPLSGSTKRRKGKQPTRGKPLPSGKIAPKVVKKWGGEVDGDTWTQGSRKDKKANKRSRPPKGWNSNDMEEDIDPEEMAIMMDYIQNTSTGDLSNLSALASLDLGVGDAYGKDLDSTDEQSQYNRMLDELSSSGSDSDGHSSFDLDDLSGSSIDSDSDDNAVSRGFSSRAFSEESDDEAAIKAEFEGGASTWIKPRTVRENDPKFDMILNGSFPNLKIKREPGHQSSSRRPPSDLHDGPTDQYLSRTQLRKLNKRKEKLAKVAKKQERNQQQESAAHLKTALAQSRGSLTPKVIAFLHRENKSIRNFVLDSRSPESTMLTPMPGAVRRVVFRLAAQYRVLGKTQGSGSKKVVMVYRTQQSAVPDSWESLVAKVVNGEEGRLKGNLFMEGPRMGRDGREKGAKKGKKKAGMKGAPGAPSHAAVPRAGDVVGSSAAPIGTGNVGHKMLMAMGWKPGSGLGVEGGGGIVNPVDVMVRGKRSGLGNEV